MATWKNGNPGCSGCNCSVTMTGTVLPQYCTISAATGTTRTVSIYRHSDGLLLASGITITSTFVTSAPFSFTYSGGSSVVVDFVCQVTYSGSFGPTSLNYIPYSSFSYTLASQTLNAGANGSFSIPASLTPVKIVPGYFCQELPPNGPMVGVKAPGSSTSITDSLGNAFNFITPAVLAGGPNPACTNSNYNQLMYLPAGNYTWQAVTPGFTTASGGFTLSSGCNSELDITPTIS